MRARTIVALILIAAGVLALAYRQFSYTKERHDANVGSLEFSISEKETVSIPVWVGVGAIAAGTLLLLSGRKRQPPRADLRP